MPQASSQSDENDGKSSIYYNMFGSMTSGFFARLPFHPLDTCKAKLQVQQTTLKESANIALKEVSRADPHLQSKYLPKLRNLPLGIGKFIAGDPALIPSENVAFKNTLDVLSKTIQREGIAGLYRGVVISAIAGCPATCMYFTTYESTRRYLKQYEYIESNAFLSDFAGGFAAETVSCILWVPIDVIKERMQVQSVIDAKHRYRSVMHAIQRMAKHEGVHGLYRAYGATILSFGPFSALYLMLYEQFKQLCGRYVYGVDYQLDEISSVYIAVSACTAGGIAAVVTNPLDMIKLRMQVQRGGIYNFGYANLFDGARKLIQRESFKSMFHGSGARAAFWVPNLALNLTLYESCTRFYKTHFDFD